MPGKPDGKGSSPGRGRGQRESPLNRPCQTAGRSGRQDHAPLAEECSLDFFREAPIGIFRGHSAGKPVLVNPAMARMLGCESPRQMLEHYRDLARDFYVRPGRRQELLDTLQQRGAVEGFECEVRRIDGETIWLRMNARIAERLDDGNFTIDGL